MTLLAVGQSVVIDGLYSGSGPQPQNEWAEQCAPPDQYGARISAVVWRGRPGFAFLVRGTDTQTNPGHANARAQAVSQALITRGGIYREELAMHLENMPTSFVTSHPFQGMVLAQPSYQYPWSTPPPMNIGTSDAQHLSIFHPHDGTVAWTDSAPFSRTDWVDTRLTFLQEEKSNGGWSQLEVYDPSTKTWVMAYPQTACDMIVSGDEPGTASHWYLDVYASSQTIDAAGGEIGPIYFAGIRDTNGLVSGPRLTRIG